MAKSFYITTPIYYTNGRPHLGHAYTTVIADIIANYKKLRGVETYFLTGTDEHGEKVEINALKEGKSPKQFVDEIVDDFQQLWKRLNIKYDDFIRTTEDRHQEIVKKIFSYLLKKGDIYLGEYQGWYCTPCESFWTKTQLLEDNKCPDCGRDLYLNTEEAYFFKMSKYAQRLKEYYQKHPDFIQPEAIKKEMLNNFIDKGLEDLCVTRTKLNWGIPIEEDPRHVIYVWLDALVNYITALGYMSKDTQKFEKFWQNDPEHQIIHILGKEIARFHVIYWPIFLMALDLPLPTKLICHGWIILKEGKMSKSKGSLVDPNIVCQRYGVDVLRYYLASELPFYQDNMFSAELFVQRINNDLVNDLGNLLRRTINMVVKYLDSTLPATYQLKQQQDQEFLLKINTTIQNYFNKMDQILLDEAIKEVFSMIGFANKFIENKKPWELAKSMDKSDLEVTLFLIAESLKVAGILLQPIMPELVKKIFDHLNLDYKYLKFEYLHENSLLLGKKVLLLEPLLNRLDVDIEVEFLNGIIYKQV